MSYIQFILGMQAILVIQSNHLFLVACLQSESERFYEVTRTALIVVALKSSPFWPWACEISSPDLASEIDQDRLATALWQLNDEFPKT